MRQRFGGGLAAAALLLIAAPAAAAPWWWPFHRWAPREEEPSAPRVMRLRGEIHGDLLAEYRDEEFSHPLYNAAGSIDDYSRQATWRLVQTDLVLQLHLDEWNQVYARGTFSPGTPNRVSEAWFATDAIGPGRLTLGQFYRPRGAPIPLLNLSLPTLVFRGFTVAGAKYGGAIRNGDIRYEVGISNSNPINLFGATIGNDGFVTSRPYEGGTWTNGPREYYAHLGHSAGGSWGTLDLGVTAVIGRLHDSDVRTLASSGMFRRNTNDRVRQVWEAFVDYLYGPLRVYGDYVHAEEGDLGHEAWEIGASYRLPWNLRATGSYGRYLVKSDFEGFTVPASWDRDRTSAGLVWEAAPGVQVQAEYQWIDENVLDPLGREIRNDLGAVQVLTYW